LRDRKEIFIYCFRKFAADFAHKYKCTLKLDDSYGASLAKISLGRAFDNYNVAEQLSVLETSQEISLLLLYCLIYHLRSNLPSVIKEKRKKAILVPSVIFYTSAFDDLNDLKKINT
jgi:hypothetical protein